MLDQFRLCFSEILESKLILKERISIKKFKSYFNLEKLKKKFIFDFH